MSYTAYYTVVISPYFVITIKIKERAGTSVYIRATRLYVPEDGDISTAVRTSDSTQFLKGLAHRKCSEVKNVQEYFDLNMLFNILKFQLAA